MSASGTKTICNGCGSDVQNGGLNACIIVSDMTASGKVAILHYCRKNGCAERALAGTTRNVADVALLGKFPPEID